MCFFCALNYEKRPKAHPETSNVQVTYAVHVTGVLLYQPWNPSFFFFFFLFIHQFITRSPEADRGSLYMTTRYKREFERESSVKGEFMNDQA
jgi:hypothetical protein